MPFDSVATTERQQLRLAVRHCRERGLYEAAKWAAVQLNGLRPDPEGATPANDPSPTDDPNLTSAEDDAHHLALAHFDVRVGAGWGADGVLGRGCMHLHRRGGGRRGRHSNGPYPRLSS